MRFAKFQRFVTIKSKTHIKPLDSESPRSQHVLNFWLSNNKLRLVICAVCLLLSNPLMAVENDDNRAYYGMGFGSTTGDGLRFNTLDLQAGYEFRPWVSFEGHLGGTSSDSDTQGNVTVNAKLEYYNSIRVRFNMVARDYRAYAFLGFTTVKIDQNDDILGSNTIKRAGYAYGIGIDLFGNESTALYASLGKLLDKDIDDTDTKFSQMMVGFRYYLRDNYKRSRIPDRLQF